MSTAPVSLPAGYVLNTEPQTPRVPAGYTIDATVSGNPPKESEASGPGNHFADIIGDAIKNGPSRFMEFMSGHPYEDLKQHAYEMGLKAKEAFKSGDTSTGIGYLTAAFLPGVGDEAIKAGEEFGSGNPSGGIGHAVLALAPFLGPPALEATAPYAGAAAKGVAMAAPEAATGLAKVAAGELVSKVPGLEWPARIGLQYPGLRQVAKSVPKGIEAFKAALESYKPTGPPAVAEATAAAPEAATVAPVASGVPAGAGTVAPPATLDDIAVSLTGKKFDQLKGPDQAKVLDTHAAIMRTANAPAAAAQFTPEEEALARHVLQNSGNASPSDVLNLPPSANPRVPLRPPMAQPPAVSPAEALRDMLAPAAPRNAQGVATIGATPQPTAAVPQAPLDAGMLSLPPAVRQAAADANYRAQATTGEGVPGAQAYEAAGRSNKVTPLVDSLSTKLQQEGISAADAAILTDPKFKPHWAALAHSLGIKEPSAVTVSQVIKELQRRETVAQ